MTDEEMIQAKIIELVDFAIFLVNKLRRQYYDTETYGDLEPLLITLIELQNIVT